MKLTTFSTLVNNLGFKVEENSFGHIEVRNDRSALMTISSTYVGIIDSNYPQMRDSEAIERKLSILEYATRLSVTPIEDRKEIERFKYKVPEFLIIDGNYINRSIRGSIIFDNSIHTDVYGTEFTDAEVESFDEATRKVFAMCEKIKVEVSE